MKPITSATPKLLKTLLVAPLLLAGITGYSQKTATKTYMPDKYGMVNLGAKIDYDKGKTDTIEMEDPATKEIIKRIIKMDPKPVKLNGKDFIVDNDYADAASFKGNGTPQEYIFTKMKANLAKLENGFYTVNIFNIMVDEKGKTWAFSYEPVTGTKTEDGERGAAGINIDPKIEKAIFENACNTMANMPLWKPAEHKGTKVVGEANGSTYRNKLKVDNHKVYLKIKDTWKAL